MKCCKKRYVYNNLRVLKILNILIMSLCFGKALYGLKQAPRAWYDRIIAFVNRNL